MASLLSDELVGTWELISFVARDADGRETHTYGPDPRGILIYDEGGRMSVQIARSHQRPFQSADPAHASPAELKEALDAYFGYFGEYTLDKRAGIVTHHVKGGSFPNIAGSDQRRLYTLLNDRLVLTTKPGLWDGSTVTYVATWGREAGSR